MVSVVNGCDSGWCCVGYAGAGVVSATAIHKDTDGAVHRLPGERRDTVPTAVDWCVVGGGVLCATVFVNTRLLECNKRGRRRRARCVIR